MKKNINSIIYLIVFLVSFSITNRVYMQKSDKNLLSRINTYGEHTSQQIENLKGEISFLNQQFARVKKYIDEMYSEYALDDIRKRYLSKRRRVKNEKI